MERLTGEIMDSRTGAAGSCMSLPQIIAVNQRFCSADTPAIPSRLPGRSIGASTNYGQVTKDASGQIVQVIDAIAHCTRSRMARQQIALVNEPFSAAGALAEPTRLSTGTIGTTIKHGKSSESLGC